MSRSFIILAAISALAGCYNPPYPPDTAGVGPLPQDTGSAQDPSMRARRHGAAASGSSTGTEQ